MLHFCNIQFTLSLIVDVILHNFNICSLLHCSTTALLALQGCCVPLYCSMLVCCVVGSYCSMLVWRGGELLGWCWSRGCWAAGCTAALLWAAPPTPHNLLAITFRLSASSLAPVYIKIFYPLTILRLTSCSLIMSISSSICLHARYILSAIPAV